MRNNESTENYLEAILILSKRLPVVRSIDIANFLKFSKPSVSVAMKNLRSTKMVEVSDAGYITLTEAGLAIASSVYERHEFFTKWLTDLGVDPQTAAEDACSLEHRISEESFLAIKKHLSKHHSFHG